MGERVDPGRVESFSMSLARIFAIAGMAASLGLASLPARAADDPAQGWTITLKGHVGVSPAWEGSKDLSPYLLPGLSARRAGAPLTFSAPDDAPGFALYDEGWLKAGVAGRLKGPRRASDNAELRGVHDIDWTLEAGAFAEFWPIEKFRARIDMRHGFLGHHGNIVDLSADWVERHGPWTVSFGPRMSLGDTRYMDKLFGANAWEAFANGHIGPFTAQGGAKSVGLMGAVSYEWSKSWTTTGYAKWNRLVGSAASSPLSSNLGSRNQFSLGGTVAYSFDWAGF